MQIANKLEDTLQTGMSALLKLRHTRSRKGNSTHFIRWAKLMASAFT